MGNFKYFICIFKVKVYKLIRIGVLLIFTVFFGVIF